MLELDDISFSTREVRLCDRKNTHPLTLPLPEGAIKAIAAYVVGARPKSKHRVLFLSLHPPYGPLGEDINPYLLICAKDKKLTRTQLYLPFRRAVKAIGLDQSKHLLANTTFGGPTPHRLRHAFAVNTLKRIKQQGKSPQNALPILAAYMGHCHYKHTGVYLKVIDAQQRLELYNFTKSKGNR